MDAANLVGKYRLYIIVGAGLVFGYVVLRRLNAPQPQAVETDTAATEAEASYGLVRVLSPEQAEAFSYDPIADGVNYPVSRTPDQPRVMPNPVVAVQPVPEAKNVIVASQVNTNVPGWISQTDAQQVAAAAKPMVQWLGGKPYVTCNGKLIPGTTCP